MHPIFQNTFDLIGEHFDWDRSWECSVGLLIRAANKWTAAETKTFCQKHEIGLWGEHLDRPELQEVIKPLLDIGLTARDLCNLEELEDPMFHGPKITANKSYNLGLIDFDERRLVVEYLTKMGALFPKEAVSI